VRQREKVPFLGGRNFLESIVYTLTYLGFQHRLDTGRENLSFLVVELERQLCGLASAVPQLKKIYHDAVREALEENYRDYPLPELGPKCHVRDVLLAWMDENKERLFEVELEIEPPERIRATIERAVDTILHQAIMGALYKAGVLSHA